MELWIRSQDKRTLLKTNRIDVDDTDIICWDNDYRCSETYMGKYKTQKRALEVLDEIQNLMTPKIRFNSIISTKKLEKYKSEFIPSNSIIVYEMPKD